MDKCAQLLAAVRKPSASIQQPRFKFLLLLNKILFVLSCAYNYVLILARTVAKIIFVCDLCKITILDAAVVS